MSEQQPFPKTPDRTLPQQRKIGSPEASFADQYYKMKQKEEFRHAFLNKAFGIKVDQAGILLSSPVSKSSEGSKMLTKKDYKKKIEIMEKWDQETHSCGMTKYKYRKANRIGHKLKKKFVIVQNALGAKTLHRLETNRDIGQGSLVTNASNLRIAVHQEQVFDVIFAAHQQSGHKAAAVTHNRIKTSYWNISEELVKIFVSLCPTCLHKHPKAPKFQGAQKPIVSWAYRDRSQVDLIDYRMDPQHLIPQDSESPICEWLMVVKDHFSRTVFTRPIRQSKRMVRWV